MLHWQIVFVTRLSIPESLNSGEMLVWLVLKRYGVLCNKLRRLTSTEMCTQ